MELASAAFSDLTQERWLTGAKEYGDFAFLSNDTFEMLEEELADIANYARMTFIKVQLLKRVLAEKATEADMDAGTTGANLGKLDGPVDESSHGYWESGDIG